VAGVSDPGYSLTRRQPGSRSPMVSARWYYFIPKVIGKPIHSYYLSDGRSRQAHRAVFRIAQLGRRHDDARAFHFRVVLHPGLAGKNVRQRRSHAARSTTAIYNFRVICATAWLGLAIIPSAHYATLQPARDAQTGAELPPPISDEARAGRRVYLADGCVYCHSQQVRPENAGSDIARGWGQRRSVARDELKSWLEEKREGPVLIDTELPENVAAVGKRFCPRARRAQCRLTRAPRAEPAVAGAARYSPALRGGRRSRLPSSAAGRLPCRSR